MSPSPVLVLRALNRRTLLLLLALAVALAGLALAAPDRAQAATPSAAHPYSDPVYLPLHSAFGVDCVRNNPGCANDHNFWGMDIVPSGQFGPHGQTSHAQVFSMGAGIVHIGNAHGTSCGNPVASFGTWIWIDHGAGVISRYGHLSRILVHNGQHVAAGQPIGVVGTTGKGKNCGVSYLDFMVMHNGLRNANSVEFKTLRACVGSTTQNWPTSAASTRTPSDATAVHYATWNAVHQGTQFPASTGNCVPGAPATALRPSAVAHRTSAGRATVGWGRPAGSARVNRVMVEFASYHTSTHEWDSTGATVYRVAAPSTSSTSFTGLEKTHTYRARVSVHNGAGWSSPTPWLVLPGKH